MFYFHDIHLFVCISYSNVFLQLHCEAPSSVLEIGEIKAFIFVSNCDNQVHMFLELTDQELSHHCITFSVKVSQFLELLFLT